MMEEFYFEESNTKHIFLKSIIYLFIIGVCIGIFYFYKKQNTLRIKDITIEVGTTLSKDIKDYLISGINNSEKYKLYLNDVDINTVGKYSYKVKYNKHTKKGIIKVVDTTEPKVILDNITIGVKENFNPNLLLASCDDYSLPCVVTFNRESDIYKLKNTGVYDIKFNISDSQGNVTVKSAKITVSETESLSSKMTNDLNYYTNSENDDKIEHIFFKKLDKAIYEDTSEYEGIIHDISSIDFDKYVDGDIYSTKLITAYNKYGYVIGIQVEVTFVDGTKKLVEDKVNSFNEE